MAVELAPAMLLHHGVLQTAVSENNTEQGTIRLLSCLAAACLRQSKAPTEIKILSNMGKADR